MPAPRPDALDDSTLFAVLVEGFLAQLRALGLPVGVSAALAYTEALSAAGAVDRRTRYWCGRATLVKRPEDIGIYDAAFASYWGGEDLVETVRISEEVSLAVDADDEPDGGEGDGDGDDLNEVRFSAYEVLIDKDFADYSDEELKEAALLMARMRSAGARRQSRRLQPHKGDVGTFDLRRTVRAALGTGGEPLVRRYQKRGTQYRRVVLLLDVSGSMESYSRALLRFVHASTIARRRVEAFVFGTRLTRVTRELSSRDPDRALAAAAATVVDFAGGTRIGASLRTFNDEWGVRGMARGSTVVILSDGWDRGEPEVLSEQMARLHRVAHKVVWVNPLKATEGYAPIAQGMAAALPYCDEFIEGHSLRALDQLARVMSDAESTTKPNIATGGA